MEFGMAEILKSWPSGLMKLRRGLLEQMSVKVHNVLVIKTELDAWEMWLLAALCLNFEYLRKFDSAQKQNKKQNS